MRNPYGHFTCADCHFYDKKKCLLKANPPSKVCRWFIYASTDKSDPKQHLPDLIKKAKVRK